MIEDVYLNVLFSPFFLDFLLLDLGAVVQYAAMILVLKMLSCDNLILTWGETQIL